MFEHWNVDLWLKLVENVQALLHLSVREGFMTLHLRLFALLLCLYVVELVGVVAVGKRLQFEVFIARHCHDLPSADPVLVPQPGQVFY